MSERVTKWRGVLNAAEGTLLGGVRHHASVWFSSFEEAKAWLAQAIETNKGAGRHLGQCYVEPRQFLRKLKKNPRKRRAVRRNPARGRYWIGIKRDATPVVFRAKYQPDSVSYPEYVSVSGPYASVAEAERRHVSAGRRSEFSRPLTYSPFIVSRAKKNPRKRRTVRRNPSDGVRIVHNKLLGGWFIVRGPHQTPIGGRFPSKEAARYHLENQRRERDARVLKNPKRRAQRVPTRAGRFHQSGRKFRYQIQDHIAPKPGGRSVRFRMERADDPRKRRRKLRKAGFRVNPTARRGSFVVRAKQPGGTFQQIAAFVSKPQAINYAKALARSNPRATIAVHGRGAIIDRRFD